MKVSRRLVLRGLGGVALSLPLLEGVTRLVRARAEAQAAPDTTYAIFFRQANGVACAQNTPLDGGSEPERFWPTEAGALTSATLSGRALDELEAHVAKLLVVGNVNMFDFDYADGHARGALQGLTARGPVVAGAAGDSEAAGESIDHRIGRELNPEGRDSLFLYAGVNRGWLGGACISYRGADDRRAALHNPRLAYEAMIGGGQNLSEEASMRLSMRKQSVNDLVRDQLTRVMQSPKLSGQDRQRLELHFDSIRDLEVRMGCMLVASEEQALSGADAIYESGDGDDVLAIVRMHMDVAALAVSCGYTRSVAIQVGNGNDGDTRFRDPDTGQLMENFHYVSHRRLSHDSSGAVIANSDVLHHKVDRQFAQTFKHLIEKLESYPMPDGQSLLQHGVSVWYNDLGNGPDHSPNNAPFVLAGSCGGYFKQGEYIELNGGQRIVNHARMLNTLGTAVGCTDGSGGPLVDFGDPSLDGGLLDEIKA